MKESKNYIGIKIVLVLATLFFGIAFVAWTVVPNSQIIKLHKAYQKAIDIHDPTVVTKDTSIFEPYTSVQPMLRYVFLEFIVSAYNAGEKEISIQLIPFAIEKLKESLGKTTPYLNSYLYLGYGNDVLAMASSDPKVAKSYFTESAKYYEEGLKMFPNQQTIIKRYGLSLYNDGKHVEAIDLYKSALATENNVPELHYFLGQFQVYENDKYMNEAFDNLEYALGHDFNQNIQLTQSAYKKMFAYFYKKNDAEHLLMLLGRLGELDPQQKEKYAQIADYIKKSGQIPELELNW